MNIIFPFIILYYSNHLRLQFELSKNSILMKQINKIYVIYREIYQISICCTSTSTITEQKVWKVEEEVFFNFAECHEPDTRQKHDMPSAMNLPLGKGVLCLVPEARHSANTTSVTASARRWVTWRACALFAECNNASTRQNLSLPCAWSAAHSKTKVYRVFVGQHSANI